MLKTQSKALWAIVATILAGIAVSVSAGSSQASSSQAPQRAVLEKYCVTCHSQAAKDKGLVPVALDKLDLSHIGSDAESISRSRRSRIALAYSVRFNL